LGDEGAAAIGQSWRDVDGVGAPEGADTERG